MKSERQNIKAYKWISCLIISVFILISASEAAAFPNGWESMEIEAKWDATESAFNAIVAAFPHGGTKYGYELNVRWSGKPRRYIDLYYDDSTSELFNALHMLRHRQRYRTPDSIAITDSFADLENANWSILNWEKVQYKSTPTRLSAVWLRNEQGDAQLDSLQVTDTLEGSPPHPPYSASDDPIALLLSDHAGFDFTDLSVVLEVLQFRYRVEFLDPDSGDALYELSLDKIITTVPGQPPENSHGVELEVLKDGAHVGDRVDGLFILMENMEAEFDLTRATKSKGGIEVVDSAVPIMRLHEMVLDYHELELGFAFTKAIVVYNDGYASLVVSVSNQSTGDPDLTHWSELNEAANVIVPPGDEPLILLQIYEPQALGSHSIQFQVTSNDPANPSQIVPLIGQAIAPIPIDSVLVLDRSGSMREIAGERQKIDAMRDAADQYAHLLRRDIGGSGTGDKIGFVKYNHTNQIYLPLDFVDDPSASGSHMEQAEEALSNDAITDSNRLKPEGTTGIGGAMQTAAGMFTVPAGGRKHVMVVLTDGIENEAPYINDVIGPIQANDPDLSMYSVGVGANIEEDKLQNITNRGNGYHQVSGDLSGVSVFDLETFYFKIFSNATGMDLVVDPTTAVPLVGDQPTVVGTARITSSDRRATFLVLDSPALRRFYDLELLAPNGQIMGPGVTVGGVGVQHLQRYTYTIYKVVLPDVDTTSEYLGDWVLRLTPKGRWNPKAMKALLETQRELLGYVRHDPQTGPAPIGFAAAVASNYRMQVAVLPSNYLPGAPVLLTATLTDRGWPARHGRVLVDVTGPNGDLIEVVRLYDDGTHGDLVAQDGTWTGQFIQTGASGSYRFLFRSLGANANGELVPREASRYVTLMQPSKDPAPPVKECIPCRVLWVIIIVFAILAIWLLWAVYRRA